MSTAPNTDINPDAPLTTVPATSTSVPESVEAERIKALKESLDRAFAERDALAAKLADKEAKERELEIKSLKDAGKLQEAYELQLTQERAEKDRLKLRNIELTRDIELRDTLVNLEFRNENAARLARQEIERDLVQDENGEWRHRTGVSITDYVKAFVANKANEFLFKVKINNGSGDLNPDNPSDPASEKSLFDLSNEEILKRAASGNLRKRRK
jgi:hypothetical protein